MGMEGDARGGKDMKVPDMHVLFDLETTPLLTPTPHTRPGVWGRG
jgi:hypothetical protein